MLTVILPTYNGADTLPQTLESFTRLEAPTGDWKLIVVDNASTDETPAILQSYQGRLPMQVLKQPSPGKSKALNLAMNHIEGDFVVFTDDDVLPEPDWLTAWRSCADENPEFGLFGGHITPHWQDEPPAWLAKAIPLGIAYAATKKGLLAGPVDPLYIAGPNMAVRAVAIKQGGRFDDDSGPSGKNYAMGEDTKFAYTMAENGYAPYHCPAARVGHIVQREQYSKAWLKQRAFRYGQSRATADVAFDHFANDKLLFGLPRWLIRQYFVELARSLIWSILFRSDRHMQAVWNSSYLAGYMNILSDVKE